MDEEIGRLASGLTARLGNVYDQDNLSGNVSRGEAMSRGLVILFLIAMPVTPLVALAESAERLAASLLEQSDPGVIDPVDGRLDDGVSLASNMSAHPLNALTIDLPASILDDWTGAIGTGRSTVPIHAEPAGAPFWPSPSRERRLSWLQTFVI